MTHDELRRDAERLANLDEPQDMTADDMAAKDRLAENVLKMTDPTPVDRHFAKSIGFTLHDKNDHEDRYYSRVAIWRETKSKVDGTHGALMRLEFAPSMDGKASLSLRQCGETVYLQCPATRGDVLRLLDALSVPAASRAGDGGTGY